MAAALAGGVHAMVRNQCSGAGQVRPREMSMHDKVRGQCHKAVADGRKSVSNKIMPWHLGQGQGGNGGMPMPSLPKGSRVLTTEVMQGNDVDVRLPIAMRRAEYWRRIAEINPSNFYCCGSRSLVECDTSALERLIGVRYQIAPHYWVRDGNGFRLVCPLADELESQGVFSFAEGKGRNRIRWNRMDCEAVKLTWATLCYNMPYVRAAVKWVYGRNAIVDRVEHVLRFGHPTKKSKGVKLIMMHERTGVDRWVSSSAGCSTPCSLKFYQGSVGLTEIFRDFRILYVRRDMRLNPCTVAILAGVLLHECLHFADINSNLTVKEDDISSQFGGECGRSFVVGNAFTFLTGLWDKIVDQQGHHGGVTVDNVCRGATLGRD